MYGPPLFAAAVGLCVLIAFVATWRLAGQRDPVDERLREFGASDRDLDEAHMEAGPSRRPGWSGTNRMLTASGLGPRLAGSLAQADLPLTAAEFTLLVVAGFLVGLFIGALRLGLGIGIALGLLLAWLPILYLRHRQHTAAARLFRADSRDPDAAGRRAAGRVRAEPGDGHHRQAARAPSLGRIRPRDSHRQPGPAG